VENQQGVMVPHKHLTHGARIDVQVQPPTCFPIRSQPIFHGKLLRGTAIAQGVMTMAGRMRWMAALVLFGLMAVMSPSQGQEKGSVFDLNSKKETSPGYTREVGGRVLSEWMNDLKNIDPSVRERALRAIPLFGPPASEAVPIILERCLDRDASPRVRAVGALGMLEIAEKDVPKVIEALAKRISDDPQSAIKFQAMMTLSRFGIDEGKIAIPALAKMAEDPTTWEARKLAVSLLGKFGYDAMRGPDIRCLRAMVVALKDQSMAVRQEAVYGLAVLGRPLDMATAQVVEKALSTMTDNKDKGISIWAHVGMMNLTKADGAHLKPIMKQLNDKDAQVRILALRAIGTLGKLALFGLPELIDMLNDKEPEVQYNAIWAIASMGTSAEKAVTPLRTLYQKTTVAEPVRVSARMAVEQITGKKEPALVMPPPPALMPPTMPVVPPKPATEK
jgi:HEAT repeat protein